MADAATAVRAGAGPIDGSMAPPRRWRAICELAWLESGRLLRHPLVMIGALVSVLSLWLASRGQPHPAPELVTGSGLVDEVLRRIGPGRLAALQLATLDTQVALVALLPATFMASNLAALRARRHATEELYGTAATAPWQRTAAHLLANGPIGLLALLLAGVSILLQARSAGAVGAPDPFELLAGPAAVVIAGALGVLLATWLRSALYGPVAVLGLAVIHFRLDGEHPRRWLSLIAGLKQGAVPPDLLLRPSGLHLAYLAGLGALAGAAALLRHGPRRPVAIALALGLIATGATGAAQLDGPSAADRAHVRQVVDHPDQVQVCQRRGRVRYCAFPDYRSWIPRWQSATEAVLAPLPDGAVGDLTVRQSLAPWPYSPDLPGNVKTLRTDGNPWAVFPGEAQAAMGWGPGGGRPVLPRLRLEEQVALAALRLPNWPEFGNPSSTAPLCRATAVVALWLVVQADPQARAVLRHTLALNYSFAVYQSGSRSFKLPSTWMPLGPPDGDEMAWGWQALSYADQLARRPTGEVRSRLQRHWKLLSAPSTPLARAVEVFALRPVPTIERQLVARGVDRAEASSFAAGTGEETRC